MKVSEVEKLCFMNYLVGGFVFISSVLGILFISFFKDIFPGAFNYSQQGIGVLQGIVILILILIALGAYKFITITKEYHDAYGL
jgi:hypothetical protein